MPPARLARLGGAHLIEGRPSGKADEFQDLFGIGIERHSPLLAFVSGRVILAAA